MHHAILTSKGAQSVRSRWACFERSGLHTKQREGRSGEIADTACRKTTVLRPPYQTPYYMALKLNTGLRMSTTSTVSSRLPRISSIDLYAMGASSSVRSLTQVV